MIAYWEHPSLRTGTGDKEVSTRIGETRLPSVKEPEERMVAPARAAATMHAETYQSP